MQADCTTITPTAKWAGLGLVFETEDEQASYETLVSRCHEEGLIQWSATSTSPHGNEDCGVSDAVTLLRFLRGKSCNVDVAFQQFKLAQEIRGSFDFVAEYESIDIDDFDDARNIYPHWTGGRDRSGRPICFYQVGLVKDQSLERYNQNREPRDAACGATASLARRQTIMVTDYLTRFVFPLCSAMRDRPEPERALSSGMYVVDASGLTFSRLWGLRNLIQDFNFLLSTCYPEILQHAYIINPPLGFGAMWNLVKRWLDPRTASKFTIVPAADTLRILEESIDIENIPTLFGGNFSFQHGMQPKLESAMIRSLTLTPSLVAQLPPGPIQLRHEDGRMELVAVGTLEEKERQDLLGHLSLLTEQEAKIDGGITA